MSFVKKVKRKVKDTLQIPSRSRTPDSRSSPGPTNRTPSQLSAAFSSVSIVSPANPAGDASIHAAVPPTLSAGASHNCPVAANPIVTPGQEVMAIPVVAVTGERAGGRTTWAGLKGFLGLLDRSADVFGPLRSAVDGIMTCVEIYERVGQGREEYESLRQELNSLFEELSQYFGGSASPGITSSFHNLAKEIEKEMKVVEEKGQRSVIERVAEAQGDRDEVLECYRRVERLLQRIAINANVRVWKVVDEQMTEQRLRNLSPSLSAKYSSSEAKTVGRAGCTPNTRIDVLKGLGDWAHGKDSEKIYWLNGMAGTGKTTIAYTLCDQLHKDSKLAASFFCSRQLPECRNASLIFPTIAYQLARFSLPFRFSLSHAIERDPDVCAQQLSVQFQTLILEPLRAAKDGLPDDLVVTIDALDECENPDSVGQILDVLFPNALDLPVKFLITSRPEPQIRRRMLSRRGERTRFELHLHDLDRGLVKEDIKTYLGDELKEMRLASTDLERFADRSGALFIYAATLVRYLSFENFARGPDRMQLVLGATVISSEPTKQKREGTPGSSSEEEVDVTGRSEAEVIALYTAILKAAMEDSRLEKREKVERRRVLHTVVCAQEPLTLSAIAGLMGLSSSDSVQRALQPLLSVIRISEESGVVTTLHESFPNYLCNKHRSGEFHCDTAKHNGWLANRCFAVMKMPDPPFNICKLESSYVFDEEVENLGERIEALISRELVYACRYWGAHLVVGEVSKRLVGGLSEFLETRFLLWMEVMNLTQSLSLGGGMLRNIQVWCKKAECSVEARELAVDGWNFFTMYSSSPIVRSTPHIYVSALPFWSKARPIAKRYLDKMRGLIGIRGMALELRTSTPLATCKHKTSVLAVAYSPDGTRIASGTEEGVHIWDAYTGQIIHRALGDDTWTARSVAYSPDGVIMASGSDGGTVDLWDARTGQRIGEPLRGHTRIVFSVVYSPDGTQIASGSGDTTVRIWDAHTGESIGDPLRGHTDYVVSVAYSPDGTSIASGSDDHTVRIWDARTGQMKGEPLQGHTGYVFSVAYSPDGMRIVSGSYDNSLRTWDAHTGQSIGKPFHGHTAPVHSVAYSPDGSRIVSASHDNTVRIWDAYTGQTIGEPLRRHIHFFTSVAYSPDGARILSGTSNGTLQIWDAYTQENTRAVGMGHTAGIKSVRYSPDGTRILSCSLDNSLRIWDAHTGQMIGDPLIGRGHDIKSADYSPSGAHIVSGSSDGSIHIWDAQTGQTIGEPWAGYAGMVKSIAYLPDGDRIVSLSLGDTVRIWDVVKGQSICEQFRIQNKRSLVACSPDGARIISGSPLSFSSDLDLRVRDAHTGQIIGEPLRGHTRPVTSVAYSPDGAQIVTGCGDTTARIWNAHTGQAIGQPFQGHTGSIYSVSYSPDGARIVTASEDMTLRIWNVHTGQKIGEPLRGHTSGVGSAVYSPDGSRIVSGSWDCSVRIWDAYSQDPDASGHHIRLSNTRTMDETGWVVDEKSRPLIWVPYDLQGAVLCHPHVAIISRQGYLCVDLDQAAVGELWRSCYRAWFSPGFA